METAAVLEQSEQIAAPAIAAPPEQAPIMTLSCYGGKLTREQLSRVPTPCATATHKPIPHIEVVKKLIEALSFRQIGVVREEYAVSTDGTKMFGVMDLTSGFQGCRFASGLPKQPRQIVPAELHSRPQSLRLRHLAFTESTRRCWQSTTRISCWRTASLLEWIACSETLAP